MNEAAEMSQYLPYTIGGVISFGVTMLIFIVRRLYRTNDLLFHKFDALAQDNFKFKLGLMKLDPTLYEMLFGSREPEPPKQLPRGMWQRIFGE